jgi:hypothetical protein
MPENLETKLKVDILNTLENYAVKVVQETNMTKAKELEEKAFAYIWINGCSEVTTYMVHYLNCKSTIYESMKKNEK